MNPAEANLVDQISPPSALPDKSTWIKMGLLAGLIAILYYEILGRLAMDWWNDPNFSHGFLIPLFSVFVIWQNRKHLATMPIRPSWIGLFIIAGSLGILVVGVLGAEFFLSRSSLIFLLAGLIIYYLGWRYFFALLFPWAFLFFMIPIPAIIFNQVAFPLQFLAAKLASVMLTTVGVPVLRDGNIIQLPTMTLEVAQACSGIRSLMSLGALAVIFGYFAETGIVARVLLALSSIPIAVVANGFRIMGTGLLGNYWDPEKAEGFFHEFSGWVIFVVSILLMFLFHTMMRWIGPKDAPKAQN